MPLLPNPPYLYVILDTQYPGDQLCNLAQQCTSGGVKLFQLRAKDLPAAELEPLAKRLLNIIKSAAPDNLLIINDNPQLCLSVGADGVHLGQEDMNPLEARRLLGSSAIIGASIHNRAEAQAMDYEAIDYVGVGPVFSSPTKQGLAPLTPAGFASLRGAIRRHSDCPLVAIGGIKYENMDLLKPSRPDGIAVISAVARANDPTKVCQQMLRKLSSWQ